MQDFKKLRVWRRGMDTATCCYRVTKSFPNDERYELRSQMRRSAVSIPSNIAEGSGRRSKKEFIRFLRISYGSACELETQALLAVELGLGDEADLRRLLRLVDETQRMLTALIGSALAAQT